MKQHNDLCIGIDNGTTNSVIASAWREHDALHAMPAEVQSCVALGANANHEYQRSVLLPSIAGYLPDGQGGHQVLLGNVGKKLALTKGYPVVQSVKSQMGQEKITTPGWSADLPDQTPQEVTARFIQHLMDTVNHYYEEEDTDAVIAIPASFDAAQCLAVLKAAELAGLDVRNEDGEYDDTMLIAEPEAVIYFILNEINNGALNLRIDFDTPKNILVFDQGGGTLDIFIATVVRRKDGFDIEPLATNRYSTVAGDAFDKKLMEKMYENYLAEYRNRSETAYQAIIKKAESVKCALKGYAEELKIATSKRQQSLARRNKRLPQDEWLEYGGYMPTGYSSEGTMQLQEFEHCFDALLGYAYQYQDYKRVGQIQDENNIIYPILNALNKAAQKLGVDDITIDAVIMNGAMSSLYLCKERLTEFFGFSPIAVSNPDTAVAQGAAVYHHFLHQNTMALPQRNHCTQQLGLLAQETAQTSHSVGIRSVSNILNESIYLGLKGGVVQLVAQAGQELPFVSEVIQNCALTAGKGRCALPLKRETAVAGQYKTIACGALSLQATRYGDAPVSLQVKVGRNGVVSIDAWQTITKGEKITREKATVTLQLTDEMSMMKLGVSAILPPAGAKLVPANELNAFCNALTQLKNEGKRKHRNAKNVAINRLNQQKETLKHCANPEDFAVGMLQLLQRDATPVMAMNLLPVAKELCGAWSDAERKELSKLCLAVLSKALNGLGGNAFEMTAQTEAILCLGACGQAADLEKLRPLYEKKQFVAVLKQVAA